MGGGGCLLVVLLGWVWFGSGWVLVCWLVGLCCLWQDIENIPMILAGLFKTVGKIQNLIPDLKAVTSTDAGKFRGSVLVGCSVRVSEVSVLCSC